MKLRYEFAVTDIPEGKMAFVIGEGMEENHSLLRMNDVGAVIFEKLHSEISEEQLIAEIRQEYPDASPESCTDAVRNFTEKLERAGLLLL